MFKTLRTPPAITRFLRNRPAPAPVYRHSPAVTIRWGTPADAESIGVIAELDGASTPPAPVLLGFVGDELWTAISACTGELISNPFKPSAEVAALIIERRRQLTG